VRRRALLAALLAAPVGARAQNPNQSQTALAFLQGLYEPYKRADFKGQPYWEADRFFVPELADAIGRDMAEAKKRNEPPLLNGDPFVDAQDWVIPSFGYAVSTQRAGYGAGVVTFANQDRPRQLALFLVETPQGWRIDDIVSRGSSLRAMYKLR